MYSSTAKIGQGCIGKDQRFIMVEITASDIYWIGTMDKISLGLIFLACLSALLIICAIQIYSGAMALFGALLGIACTTAFIFIPSSQTMAAMKVLPANRQQSANTGDLREHCETNRTVSERESGNIEKQR